MNNADLFYELTLGFFDKLVDLCDILYNFLFQEITIGDWSISLWALIGGVSFTIFIVAWFVKKLVPVA